jgi:hypothetical protein
MPHGRRAERGPVFAFHGKDASLPSTGFFPGWPVGRLAAQWCDTGTKSSTRNRTSSERAESFRDLFRDSSSPNPIFPFFLFVFRTADNGRVNRRNPLFVGFCYPSGSKSGSTPLSSGSSDAPVPAAPASARSLRRPPGCETSPRGDRPAPRSAPPPS